MPKKVLIIDDEPEFVKAVIMRLDVMGYTVISANGGKAGIAMAKKEKPDLILLDLVMAKMDGLSVLAELKNNPYTAGIPVIMLTAKSESEYRKDSENLGAIRFLPKPLGMRELEEAVREYI